MEPSDPWGETLEAQILIKKKKKKRSAGEFVCIPISGGSLGIVQCIIRRNKKNF